MPQPPWGAATHVRLVRGIYFGLRPGSWDSVVSVKTHYKKTLSSLYDPSWIRAVSSKFPEGGVNGVETRSWTTASNLSWKTETRVHHQFIGVLELIRTFTTNLPLKGGVGSVRGTSRGPYLTFEVNTPEKTLSSCSKAIKPSTRPKREPSFGAATRLLDRSD